MAPRNPIVVACVLRYGKTTKKMRDRRKRRPKDARNHWQKEVY